MGRLVFSFSIAEESEAAHLLRRWKHEGKVLSHVIQNALEYGAKEQIDLKRNLSWHEKELKTCRIILKDVFGVHPEEFIFRGEKIGPHQHARVLLAAEDRLKQHMVHMSRGAIE